MAAVVQFAEVQQLQVELENARRSLQALLTERFAELERKLARLEGHELPVPVAASSLGGRQHESIADAPTIISDPKSKPLAERGGYIHLPMCCCGDEVGNKVEDVFGSQGDMVDRHDSSLEDNIGAMRSTALLVEHTGATDGGASPTAALEIRRQTVSFEEVPTSIFSWCMWQLGQGQQHKRLALRMLAFMTVIQHVLMFGFTEAVVFTNVERRWSPNGPKLVSCIYGAPDSMFDFSGMFGGNLKLLFGEPLPVLAIGISALVLVTYYISLQDVSVLQTPFPGEGCGWFVHALVNYAWFCQAVFLPGVFAACVAMLLADSVDALEMIMNTLAVTFLLEIDDIMYKVVLTDEQRQFYEHGCSSGKRCKTGKLHLCANTWHARALRRFDLVFMVLIFLYFRYERITGPAYVAQQSVVNFSWQAVVTLRWAFSYGFRGFVFSSAWRDGRETETWESSSGSRSKSQEMEEEEERSSRSSFTSRASWAIMVSVVPGILGLLYYGLFKTLLGSANFNVTVLKTCLGDPDDPKLIA